MGVLKADCTFYFKSADRGCDGGVLHITRDLVGGPCGAARRDGAGFGLLMRLCRMASAG